MNILLFNIVVNSYLHNIYCINNCCVKSHFDIIRKKTASLIASCCACGSFSAAGDAQLSEQMRLFGEKVGMAFQIKDDLFDYQKANNTGKPSGLDIKDKKMTLPLIYLLNNSSDRDKRRIKNIIKNHNTDNEKVSALIKDARQKMLEFRDEALEILNTFADSPARQSMANLVRFTTDRDK